MLRGKICVCTVASNEGVEGGVDTDELCVASMSVRERLEGAIAVKNTTLCGYEGGFFMSTE